MPDAVSVKPIDALTGEGPATEAVYCVGGPQADVKPVTADGLFFLGAAARRALEWARDYADVADR